jgi:hypothetical protein
MPIYPLDVLSLFLGSGVYRTPADHAVMWFSGRG